MHGRSEFDELTKRMIAGVRALGLHRSQKTASGERVAATDAHALIVLKRSGAMSQSRLARELGLRKSTVSRLVQLLSKRRWVARDIAPDDRRVVLVRLTNKGTTASQQLAKARRDKFRRLFAGIPGGRRPAMTAALSQFIRAMEASAISTLIV